LQANVDSDYDNEQIEDDRNPVLFPDMLGESTKNHADGWVSALVNARFGIDIRKYSSGAVNGCFGAAKSSGRRDAFVEPFSRCTEFSGFPRSCA
jgi:hypothetical protein